MNIYTFRKLVYIYRCLSVRGQWTLILARVSAVHLCVWSAENVPKSGCRWDRKKVLHELVGFEEVLFFRGSEA